MNHTKRETQWEESPPAYSSVRASQPPPKGKTGWAKGSTTVWAKSGCGMWGLCHAFEDTLYLTRDLMEDSAVPSNLSVPKVSDSDGAATSARAKKSPKPREHVQLFRMEGDRNKGFYSEKC